MDSPIALYDQPTACLIQTHSTANTLIHRIHSFSISNTRHLNVMNTFMGLTGGGMFASWFGPSKEQKQAKAEFEKWYVTLLGLSLYISTFLRIKTHSSLYNSCR